MHAKWCVLVHYGLKAIGNGSRVTVTVAVFCSPLLPFLPALSPSCCTQPPTVRTAAKAAGCVHMPEERLIYCPPLMALHMKLAERNASCKVQWRTKDELPPFSKHSQLRLGCCCHFLMIDQLTALTPVDVTWSTLLTSQHVKEAPEWLGEEHEIVFF